MKGYDKNKESSYLKYWDVNNLYGWTMSQTLPINDFKRVEDISEFNESFKKVIKDIFLKLLLNILKNYMIITMIYHFYLKE